MIPSNTAALLVFLTAVAPGYLYLRIIEDRVDRRARSPLLEVAGLLCVGALCTSVGGTVALAVGGFLPTVLLHLGDFAPPYPPPSWRYVASGALALAIASGVALALSKLRIRLARRKSNLAAGTVWTNTFAKYGNLGGTAAAAPLYLVVQLRDNRTVGGQLAFSDLQEDPGKRDLTLTSPIWIAEPASTERTPQPYKFLIISAADIELIWGTSLVRKPTGQGLEMSQ